MKNTYIKKLNILFSIMIILLSYANVSFGAGFTSAGIIYDPGSSTFDNSNPTNMNNNQTNAIDVRNNLPSDYKTNAYRVLEPTSYDALPVPENPIPINSGNSAFLNHNNEIPITNTTGNTTNYSITQEQIDAARAQLNLSLLNNFIPNLKANAPTISATSYILVNATTKQYYAEKSSTGTFDPGGLANLMTAYIAYRNKKMSDKLTVQKSAIKGIDKDAAIAALDEGDKITLKDAIASMFVKGCVDSANVIAENISGDVNTFVQLMNTTAKNLGCLNTVFTNPSGINDGKQLTTAYDMAIIMDKVTSIPELAELLSLPTYVLPASIRRDSLVVYSKNSIINNESPNYNKDIAYSRMGFNTNARYTIASTMNYKNNKFIIVLLKANGTQFSDTKKLAEFAKSTIE